MSFLNAEEPNVVDLIVDFGLELLWHPSLGMELGDNATRIFTDCATGARPLDIFVLEGTVIRGPDGSGSMDMFAGRPMLEWVTELSAAASIVVAIGDCACWGGIPAAAPNPSDSTGLQFHKRERGGFLAPTGAASPGFPSSTFPDARRTPIGSPRSSSHWPPAGPATSPSTTCTGRRRSSRHSRKPGVPGCSSSSTSSRP